MPPLRAFPTGVARLPTILLLAALAACGSADATVSTNMVGASVDADVKKPTPHVRVDAGHDSGHDAAEKVIYTPAPPVAPPPKAKAEGPYPIVLMHGMGGFNELANLPLTVSYFNGVQADLKAHGESEVFVTIAPPFNTSEVRAASLAPQLDAILEQTGAAKLNLIGHSQGGMDARVLVSAAGLGYADRVASVTTVATPHLGTKVADLVTGLTTGPLSGVESAAANAFLGLLQQGVYSIQSNPELLAQVTELTTPYMANTFNPKYIDAPGVVYASYAGRTNLENGDGDCDDGVYANQPSALDIPQPELQPTATYLQALGETSDGLVPVASAKWGTFMECVPADHLKECGMLLQNGPDPVSGFDHLVFFRAVVARLRAEGF
jgi:triacylglycerol lipase